MRLQRLAAVGSGIFSPVTGIHDFFHSTGSVIARDLGLFLAIVFWLALAFWVHKDARRRIRDPFLVLVATLLGLVPPYLGPILYLLFRPSETLEDVRARRVELQALEQHLDARSQPTCPVCCVPVEADYLACPVCATTLRQPCARCDAALDPLWQVCPHCASPVGPSQVDLDAALAAETRTITVVDEKHLARAAARVAHRRRLALRADGETRTPDPIITRTEQAERPVMLSHVSGLF